LRNSNLTSCIQRRRLRKGWAPPKHTLLPSAKKLGIAKWPYQHNKKVAGAQVATNMALPPTRSSNPAERIARKVGHTKKRRAKQFKNQNFITTVNLCSMAHSLQVMTVIGTGSTPPPGSPLTSTDLLKAQEVKTILTLYTPQELQ